MAILYITQQGAVLHKSGNQIVVKKDRDVLQEIPIVQGRRGRHLWEWTYHNANDRIFAS